MSNAYPLPHIMSFLRAPLHVSRRKILRSNSRARSCYDQIKHALSCSLVPTRAHMCDCILMHTSMYLCALCVHRCILMYRDVHTCTLVYTPCIVKYRPSATLLRKILPFESRFEHKILKIELFVVSIFLVLFLIYRSKASSYFGSPDFGWETFARCFAEDFLKQG